MAKMLNKIKKIIPQNVILHCNKYYWANCINQYPLFRYKKTVKQLKSAKQKFMDTAHEWNMHSLTLFTIIIQAKILFLLVLLTLLLCITFQWSAPSSFLYKQLSIDYILYRGCMCKICYFYSISRIHWHFHTMEFRTCMIFCQKMVQLHWCKSVFNCKLHAKYHHHWIRS